MNKLQVTAEQHLALKDFLSFFKEVPLKTFATHGKLFNSEYKSLNNLTIDQMAVAQFVGYEIERPTFKEGDWVMVQWNNVKEELLYKVTKINEYVHVASEEHGTNFGTSDIMRHATPVDIFWAELNRPDNFFKIGDVLVTENGHTFSIVKDSEALLLRTCYMSDAINMLDADAITAIYPVEARKEVPKNASC